MPEIKDSGAREQMSTGSQRDSRAGKGRYDLLPTFGLHRLMIHFERGAAKYEARNWELGQSLSRMIDSGLRHAVEYLQGRADEPHLDAAVWNLICALDTEERIRRGLLPGELDDLPGNPSGVDVADSKSNLGELRMRLRESGFQKDPEGKLNPEWPKQGPAYCQKNGPQFLTDPAILTEDQKAELRMCARAAEACCAPAGHQPPPAQCQCEDPESAFDSEGRRKQGPAERELYECVARASKFTPEEWQKVYTVPAGHQPPPAQCQREDQEPFPICTCGVKPLLTADEQARPMPTQEQGT